MISTETNISRLWFVVGNEADLKIDGKIVKENQTQYGAHTLFRIRTPQCASTKAIFTFEWLGRIQKLHVRVAKKNLPHDSDSKEDIDDEE